MVFLGKLTIDRKYIQACSGIKISAINLMGALEKKEANEWPPKCRSFWYPPHSA